MLVKFIRVCTPLSLIVAAILVAGCNPAANNQSNSANQTASPSTAASPGTTAQSTPSAKVNINTGSQADFFRVMPNLGTKMVHEFEEYRPYQSIQQFRKEIGKYVDQTQVAEYEKFIYVPIDENKSDAPTLQQIPGLDEGEARELIAGRPYASRDAFLTKLREKVSAADLATGQTYLVQQ